MQSSVLKENEKQQQEVEPQAELIQNKFLNDISTSQIDDNIVDYVLRCIKGPYKGKFIYVNLTQEGETFGSDPDSDLTLFIECANLSPKHAKINYAKDEDGHYRYFLTDQGSKTGTWIKIRPDIPIAIQNGMVFRVGNQSYILQYSEELIDEVYQWLSRIQLKLLIEDFKKAYIRTLEDIKNISQDLIEEMMVEEETKNKFFESLQDIQKDFPDDYDKFTLELKNLQNEDQVYKIGWSGATLSPSQQNMQNLEEEYKFEKIPIESDEDIELQIKYQYGQYWLVISPESQGSCYYQLDKNQQYILCCDDVINMGYLDFQVMRFNYGTHQDRGTRTSMEDAIVCIHDIGISVKNHLSIFGVFDGHGGEDCVKFISEKLVENFKNIILDYNQNDQYDQQRNFFKYMYDIINEAVFSTDSEFYEKFKISGKSQEQGCAATVCTIVGNYIICTNIGDCRAILSRNGQAVPLSIDQKPQLDQEKKRIIEAGGYVEFNRVNGRLGVSRTFGDFRYKKEEAGADLVTVEPEIRVLKINYLTDEFLVLACDGLFDIYSSQECVDYVRNHLSQNKLMEQDPQLVAKKLCKDIVDTSKQRKRHSDNVSVIIITLTRGIVNSFKLNLPSQQQQQ